MTNNGPQQAAPKLPVNPLLALVGLTATVAVLVPALLYDRVNRPGFSAHGYCLLWRNDLVWGLVTSDAIIGLAYMVIATTLAYLVWRIRHDLPFHWLFLSFGTFIFACGLTHIWAIVTLWQPWYYVDVSLKAVTAIASIITAIVAPLSVPRAEQMIAIARASNLHRQQRDLLLKQQQTAINTLQHSLTSKESDLVQLTAAIAAQRQEREALMQQLQQSETRYRQIVETAREGIWIVNAQGITTYVNPPMAEILDYEPAELLGQSAEVVVHADEQLGPHLYLQQSQNRTSAQNDLRLRTKGGDERWAMVSSNPLYDEHGQFAGVLAMVTDVTERRRLEEQMVQSQKLESIGKLAGGVAHDFNNLLVVIQGSVDLAGRSLPPEHEAHEDLHAIRGAADRASSLVRQLLTFARRQSGHQQPTRLDDLLRASLPLLNRLLPAHITLSVDLNSEQAVIQADHTQLEQVVVNLVVNARDAMPDGGSLTIATRRVELQQRGLPHPQLTPGAYVQLSVVDTGNGMSEEVQRRAFEPFFTTKASSGGTGLGLATSYGIIAQHGGAITIESDIGVGTRFDIYLPQNNDNSQGPSYEQQSPVSEQPGGGEMILLVEDMTSVRALAARVLRSRGYGVLEAGDGVEALELLDDHASQIDLVLSDMVMPRLGGLALAEQVTVRFPDIKLLFMSGYADEPTISAGIATSPFPLLSKPFTPAALLQAVRNALDA